MAPYSSTLAWKIPWTEEPGRLQSMGSLRVGHDLTLWYLFHGCSSKAQLLLLTLDKGYLLTAALPDLQRGIAPLGPPVPSSPPGRKIGADKA